MKDHKRDLLKQIGVTKKVGELDIYEWDDIAIKKNLSEEFIREFQKYLDWVHISKFQKLSIDFIREFIDKISWHFIWRYQVLPEDFIREFELEVRWTDVSKFQQLTDDFIIEFKDKIRLKEYFYNQEASFYIMKKFVLFTNLKTIKNIKTSRLTNNQKQTIHKMLTLKYMFEDKRPLKVK